jgi:hypothetical protein
VRRDSLARIVFADTTNGARELGIASRGTRLVKEHKDSKRRIDLAVAAVMAHDRARHLAARPTPSIYVLDG